MNKTKCKCGHYLDNHSDSTGECYVTIRRGLSAYQCICRKPKAVGRV